MTTRARITFFAAAALAATVCVASAGPAPVGTIDAWGLISFNSTIVELEPGSGGIAAVNRIDNSRFEVVFTSPRYRSLQSTVLVSCRHTVPCMVTWDTWGSNSVQVYSWEADGSPSGNGSFSILLVNGQRSPAPAAKPGDGNMEEAPVSGERAPLTQRHARRQRAPGGL
jgi:hypothetical protein